MHANVERSPRRLIVNADDLGFTPAVTAGILEAHGTGTVTSASMMVHCPGWDDAVRHVRSTPTLGVGLHLNFLVGVPITKAPSLTDARSGRFLPLTALVRRAVLGRVDAAEAGAECEAQVAAIVDAGIECAHIDSHRHVHALPVIHRAVAAVAAKLGLPLRRPLESHRRAEGGLASQLHRGVVRAAWRVSGTGAVATRAADHFIGMSMQGSTRFAEQFVAAVDKLSPGTTEFMVHPGHVDDALESIDAYTWQRERELEALVSPSVRERLQRGDLELINFRAL